MQKLTKPYILYQYKNDTKLNELLTDIFDGFNNISLNNLEEFLDIDKASGLWLDRIGLYLNFQRPLVSYSLVFGYNTGATYNGGYVYNGNKTPVSDELYKALLKSLLDIRNSKFTLEDVKANLKNILNLDKVYIYEQDKKVDIVCVGYNKDLDTFIRILNSLDDRWFGLPTGVGVNNFIYVNIPNLDEDIFIYNHSKYNNKELYV